MPINRIVLNISDSQKFRTNWIICCARCVSIMNFLCNFLDCYRSPPIGQIICNRCGRFNLSLMLRPPRFGQLPFKGGFQDRLTIPLELGLCLVEFVYACVKFSEELFNFGNNAVLFGEWGKGNLKGFKLVTRYRIKSCSNTSARELIFIGTHQIENEKRLNVT